MNFWLFWISGFFEFLSFWISAFVNFCLFESLPFWISALLDFWLKYECFNKIICNPWCLCIFTSISSDELVRPVSTETACNLQCCMLILGGVFWPFLDYIPSFLVRSQQSFLGSTLILINGIVLLIVSPYFDLPPCTFLELRWIFSQKTVSVARIKKENRSCSAKFVFWQLSFFVWMSQF